MNKELEIEIFNSLSDKKTILDLFLPESRHIDFTFDTMSQSKPEQAVVAIFPKIFSDNRGMFTEVSKGDHSFIKQINRSCSKPGTVRGFHAQSGKHCQGKLVEAVNVQLFDIIIDARPLSATFGTVKVYLLDPVKQNKLWIPRGFLHGFVVPPTAETNAYFNYMCDNIYRKGSEICVNPKQILEKLADKDYNTFFPSEFSETIKKFDDLIFSDKDLSGVDYYNWIASTEQRWYC